MDLRETGSYSEMLMVAVAVWLKAALFVTRSLMTNVSSSNSSENAGSVLTVVPLLCHS